MKESVRKHFLFRSIPVLFLFWSLRLFGQNCPSPLPGNLHDFGEIPVSWGLELRSFLYGFNRYDGESRAFQNHGIFLGASDLYLQGELGDQLFWLGEGVIRHWQNSRNLSCQFAPEGLYFTLKQAFIEWIPGPLLFRLGRQNLIFGNGLVLDHWFDAGQLDWEIGWLTGSIFGGALAVDVARSCQKKEVVEHLGCWKTLCSAEWGKHTLFGSTLSTRWLARQYVSLMVMHQNVRRPGILDRSATFASLYLRGSLNGGFSYFGELGLQLPDQVNTVMEKGWGSSVFVQKMWKTHVGSVQSRWGFLYGSGEEKAVFSPLFERMQWGERQHFSAHQGLILGLRHKWIPDFTRHLEGQIDYFRQMDLHSFSGLSDELDIGFAFKLSGSKWIKMVYSVLNIGDAFSRIHQVKLETRIVL